jgi:hypothetical protein
VTTYTATLEFSQEVSSAVAILQGFDVYYSSTTHAGTRRITMDPDVSTTKSGAFVYIKCYVRWEDTNTDDPYTGTIKVAVIATLKYANG